MSVSLEVKDCHSPHNEECAHNTDPSLACTCRRQRTRKPFRVCHVHDNQAPACIKADIILEIHPGGLLVLREKGRRKGYETTTGQVLAGLVWKEARKLAASKGKRKKSVYRV